MSGPPRPEPDVRVRRHLAWFVPEAGGVAVDDAGRLPLQEVGWGFPADVDDLVWPGTAPGTVAALACLARVRTDGEPAVDERLYLVEPVPGAPSPATGAVWRGFGAAPAGLPDALAVALAAWLAEATGRADADPRWPAFARPGAVAALADAVAAGAAGTLHHGATGAFVQRRAWSLAAVWASDDAFLKVAPPQWAAEGPVTAALARAVPDRVPAVRAHGVAAHGAGPLPWMVQQRQEGISRHGPDASVAVAAAMGELVRRTAPHLDALRSVGLVDRRPEAAAAELPALWAAEELEHLGGDERALLPALDARVRARLADLQARRPPAVLAHGDLHTGNALVAPDGRVWVIDWTDACLAWPGADVLTFVGFEGDLEGPAARAVAEAYRDAAGPVLAGWDDDALAAGVVAGLAFHALAYARIAAAAPAVQRWQLGGAVRFLVQRLLRLEGLAG
jgi:aminoglycoside phosphotransferase (APT) family kinase protein